MSKKHIVAIAALSTLAAAPVLAQDLKAGDLLVRARAVHLNSANKDCTGLDLSVNNKWLPEVDFTYFMSPNLAAELILTVPQKHTLSAGSAEIGSLKHLPPTLSLQYHFNPAGAVRPYVGVGVNYTTFFNTKTKGASAGTDLELDDSWGIAGQVGADVMLGGRQCRRPRAGRAPPGRCIRAPPAGRISTEQGDERLAGLQIPGEETQMILGNESKSGTPSGYKVAPMSYVKLEDVADRLRPLLPTVAGSGGNRIDAWRTLEITLRKAGCEYRSEEIASLDDCAAFTIPERRLIVLREDVYDGVTEENVFSRSTVIHELSHIVLEHAVTLQRGAICQHRFFEDSEWQAKALTAAIMMPL